MPPKQKFSKDQIITAALDLVRHDGLSALTARKLGDRLGSSARPIFTVFHSMEEVQQETIQAAKADYNRQIQTALAGPNAFKETGMQYIRFAKEEPKLFQLLFMTEGNTVFKLSNILSAIDENKDNILSAVLSQYGMSRGMSSQLYQEIWIFTHGIATLHATGVCDFTEEECSAMLTEVCTGILIKLKKERPEQNND